MITLIDATVGIFDRAEMFHLNGGAGEAAEANGCAYNFNRDVDKLCFKNAVSRFLRTGSKEDAFDVYFCYAEIFKTFGGYKEGMDSLLELLYQHEANSAALLAKHRDHYSHSAYVFALGLAIFMNSKNMRDAFICRYGEENLYENFLKYWGMAGLFHDIGYPYEISFMEVLEYGKKIEGDSADGGASLKVQYANLDGFIKLSDAEAAKLGGFLPEGKSDLNALFAAEIIKSFGAPTGNPERDRERVEKCLYARIVKADKYMDHAYFSAVLFMKKLLACKNFKPDQITVDAVMAMLLHNSFYRRTYKAELAGEKYEQIHAERQPLAYLLMLCDELQCWDRAPYGEISKKQQLAWDMDIYFSRDGIDLVYYFADGGGRDADRINSLVADIDRGVVNTGEIAKISAAAKVKAKDKKVYDYFSDSRFISLCKIAETINISYMSDCRQAGIKSYLRQEFDNLTLEYKLSNIAQAKNYVRHLHKINCFFSDRQLDYAPVKEFTAEELEFLAVDEHIRWVNEKVGMGWRYGADYKDRIEREQKRVHRDIVPYADLAEDEKKKDYFPINNMVKNLEAYGIKIYRMETDCKPVRALGCTGHRDLNRIKGFDEARARGRVRTYLRELGERHSLKLYCGFAEGADLLFAEEALKCGVEVIAVLPCPWKDFMKEHADGGVKFMQLLGQTKEVKVKPDGARRYEDASRYIVGNCDEMLVLWDGEKLPLEDCNGGALNRGGTYDTLTAAQAAGKKTVLF